jgi:hypothetical protein
MKETILNKIKALGGNIEKVKGKSLEEDLQAITFSTVLYPRQEDTPWSNAEESEPIYGIGKFIDKHIKLFETEKQVFYDKIINHFFRVTDDAYGQTFYKGQLFTPFRIGTSDFEEWNIDFTEDDSIDLKKVVKLTKNKKPDFINLFYNYSYPDHHYICLSDPNPENPTVFGTDHEVFFGELTNEGNLEDFLDRFMTKDELIQIVKDKLER